MALRSSVQPGPHQSGGLGTSAVSTPDSGDRAALGEETGQDMWTAGAKSGRRATASSKVGGGGAAGGASGATGGGRGQPPQEQVTFEHLKTLVEAGKTADQPSQKVARGAMAAAVLALKKDPLGFKLRSHYLKKLEDLQQDPKFSKFYNFEATSRDEAKAEEAALLAVELPEHLLTARQKRDNGNTVKLAVLFKLRRELRSMRPVWRTALSTVADDMAQAEALPADARAGSVWALIENYFNANRGAKALPSALANGLDLLVVPAAQSSANSPKNKGGAEEKAPIKAQRSSDPATDSRKSSLDSITAMPATKKGGATAAGDTKSRSNDEPIDGEKVAATGGGMDGKVNQAAMTSSSAAPTSSPLPPTKPPCAPLPPLPVVVGLERKPGDPPSYMGGLTVVSLAPVHNSQQAPQGLLLWLHQ